MLFSLALSNVNLFNMAGSVFTDDVSIDANLLEQIKLLHKKIAQPTGLVWYTNMAAVSLFWNSNMAAVTSCENALYVVHLNNLNSVA